MAGNQGDNLKDKEQKSIILECWLIHIITIQQVSKCGLLPAFRLAKRDLMDLCLHLVIFKQLILFFWFTVIQIVKIEAVLSVRGRRIPGYIVKSAYADTFYTIPWSSCAIYSRATSQVAKVACKTVSNSKVLKCPTNATVERPFKDEFP